MLPHIQKKQQPLRSTAFNTILVVARLPTHGSTTAWDTTATRIEQIPSVLAVVDFVPIQFTRDKRLQTVGILQRPLHCSRTGNSSSTSITIPEYVGKAPTRNQRSHHQHCTKHAFLHNFSPVLIYHLGTVSQPTIDCKHRSTVAIVPDFRSAISRGLPKFQNCS